MCTTKPQLRSSSPMSEPPGVPSPAGLCTGGISTSGAEAGAATAIAGCKDPAEDDAAADCDAACLVTRFAKPQRLSTATLSRSSGDKVLAFLTNLCFFAPFVSSHAPCLGHLLLRLLHRCPCGCDAVVQVDARLLGTLGSATAGGLFIGLRAFCGHFLQPSLRLGGSSCSTRHRDAESGQSWLPSRVPRCKPQKH